MVHLIKLDTEGSELWVLQGAIRLLQVCKPVIFIEISPEWLKHYSFSPSDVILWFKEHDYCLNTLNGQELTITQLTHCLAECTNNFMARPVN